MSNDIDRLAPTHYLVLDVLAARHRLGEPWWTFPQTCGKWLRELSSRGLISLMHGVVEKTVRVSLTDRGRELVLSGDYSPPKSPPAKRRGAVMAHFVSVNQDPAPPGTRGKLWAFCHTCFWKGPKVVFRHTAERWRNKHLATSANIHTDQIGTPMDRHELGHRFNFHPAFTQARQNAHEHIRARCGDLAAQMNGVLPEGREKSIVMTKLEEVMFWANAALARSPEADNATSTMEDR